MPTIVPVGRRWAPFSDLYHSVLRVSWWQFFALAAVLFTAVNVAFALLYMAFPGSIEHARPGSFADHFSFSVQTLATIGYGAMAPATAPGHVLVTIEAFLGMLTTALVTGLTFARFARPTARVVFSERIAVTPRDGVPHMMFRMANGRHNQIVEATLRVVVLVTEVTREGERMRRPIELTLVRDRTAFFWLTWTAMHRIDAASPFHGEDAVAKLRAADAEIYLSLSGLDETFSQTVHARYAYALDDIAWGARFADVLTVHPDGTRFLDYGKFHDVVPVGEAQPTSVENQPTRASV